MDILATTADGSIGHAFDKAARALGLSWRTRCPGTALEELCRMTNDELESLPDIQPFTVPMPGKFVFSFASLQSSVDRYISLADEPLSSSHKIALTRVFQTAAARQLCAKLMLSFQNLELKGECQGCRRSAGSPVTSFYAKGSEQHWMSTALMSAYRSIPPRCNYAQTMQR
ncbi:hypothetical protein DFJ58DRAFT_290826 [Suillus subalutaceus]|uniref:uncharacterized protein n=1 Tax=Suillus subalutaceus TaxID=48586 RepID=UPI001B85F344|nr:uncharacterized protein DFJ58DRAFT_290826 [Suillus subalutaceus]KAG1858954.1 hypothetical protein DFJ58DRAFT_290826 [Suillus subalutaceus]